MKMTYRWRHSVPSYPTFEWSKTKPQPGAVIVAEKKGFEAEEAISEGDMVYVSGADMIRKAIADGTGKVAWMVAEESGSIGDIIPVCRAGGVCKSFSGLTPGAIYYLSQSNAGEITTTEPGSGEIFVVGAAAAAGRLIFSPYHK